MFEDRNIVFYDGECGLCQRSVRFLMKADKRGALYFAPIQGETARSLLSEEQRIELSTLVYKRADGTQHLRSGGALKALIDGGSAWRWLGQLCLQLPVSCRDAVYDWIARNREKLGAKSACPMPNAAARQRILA